MVNWIFVTIAYCLVSELQAHTNYCSTSHCHAGVQNVGCNPPGLYGGFGCTDKHPAVMELDSTLQSLILSEHNTRRSQLAQGKLACFHPAIRMPTITWDTELARQAGNNARSCNFRHDRCRNTAVYAWAGQNLAISRVYGMTKPINELIKEGIASWWDEYKVTTQAQLNRYPAGYKRPAIGHFTQMASDQTSKIGCAMQYWLDGQWNTYYLVCNYAVTNIIGRPSYKAGPAASGCITGSNPNLRGLCSTAEWVNSVPN